MMMIVSSVILPGGVVFVKTLRMMMMVLVVHVQLAHICEAIRQPDRAITVRLQADVQAR